MKYTDLTLMQRIAMKGLIHSHRDRPAFCDHSMHRFFDALRALWILTDFKTAVETFFIK